MVVVRNHPVSNHHQKTNQQKYSVTFDFHTAKIENIIN